MNLVRRLWNASEFRGVRYTKIWLATLFLAIVTTIATIPWWLHSARALSTSWTQTDWSGGTSTDIISTTATTFYSSSNLDTSAAGEITLGQVSDWLDTDWSYRKSISLTNSGAQTLTDYQVDITIDTSELVSAGKLQSNCNDIRFTNSSGTELPFWLDEDTACNQSSTTFWVKVDTIPVGSSYVYLYYGNSGASSASNGETTFEFFDGFDGSGLNENKWTINAVGTTPYSVGSSKYSITANPSTFWSYNLGTINAQHRMKYGPVDNMAVEWRATMTTLSNLPGGQFGGALMSSTGELLTHTAYADGTSNSYGSNTYHQMPNGGAAVVTSLNVGTSWSYRFKFSRIGSDVKSYENYTLRHSGTLSTTPTYVALFANYLGGWWFNEASFSWIFTRKLSASHPSQSTIGDEETILANSGELISNIYDAELPSNWGTLSFTSSGGDTIVKVRTGALSTLADAADFSTCDAVTSGSDISSNNCVDDGDQYIQYQLSLAEDSGAPTFQDITILYQPSDATPPSANASSISISNFVSGNWKNTAPTISWTAGSDDETSIAGYCIALDEIPASSSTSNGLDPLDDAGVLSGLEDNQALSPSSCPYIVAGTSVNLGSISGLSLQSGKRYYFSIKAIDVAGNVWEGTTNLYQDQINFKFDNTPPNPPAYLSVPGTSVATKDITITWPNSGNQTATDAHSGLAGLQYRIGASGIWYGANRNGNQDLTDLLTNSGSYTTDETTDFPVIEEGTNVFYLRAVDVAGNPSSQYTTGSFTVNTVAPSEVENLTITPGDNTVNEYAISWDSPSDFAGDPATLRYCYTVNTLPTVNTCTFTTAGQTSLAAGAFATQPGTNTFYVVPKDEAGNISYSSYASETFLYSGSAPGIPLNVDVNDISTKATSSWKLSVSWSAPTDTGAGVAQYQILRSATATSCSSDPSAFSVVGTVGGDSTVFSNSNLSQQRYYYCVRACDSANNCGALSATANGYPDGKFTEAASLTSGPTVSNITSRQAVISWTTERGSDSRIQFGTESGKYFDEEVGNSLQKTDHEVKLENLFAGTTYYYRAKWIDEDGNEGQSSEKSFTTNPPPTVTDPKASSIGLDFALLEFTVKGAKKVKIYYGQNTSFGNVTEIQTATSESTYTSLLENLEDGTVYYYKINPINEDDIEYDTSILTFTTIARPRITRVEVQQLPNISQSTLLVSWQTNTETSSIVSYYPTSSPAQIRENVKNIYRLGEHKMVITGLQPQTQYTLLVKGRDKLGNEAVSTSQQVTTASDTRPPSITDVQVETSILNSTLNQTNSSQLIVTWTTDEPSTSQVEYGEGISGEYSLKSTLDSNLTYNHTVVINGLASSKVFHLRAVSGDVASNYGYSSDLVAITNKPSDEAIDLVIQNLGDAFSFLRTRGVSNE